MSILIFCPRVNGQTTLAFVNLPEKTAQETQFAFYATSVVDRNLTKDDLPDQFGEEIVALGFGSISLILFLSVITSKPGIPSSSPSFSFSSSSLS